jgi:hypothetical protein
LRCDTVFQVWFQNARAKYRRNTLKQEQQERNQIHQVAPADSTANSTSSVSTGGLDKTAGRTAALPDLSPHHQQNGSRSSSGGSRPSQAGMTSSGPQRGYPVSRSPASLSDVSSTQSSSNDMLSAGLVGNNNHASTAGLLLTDIDRGIVADSMSMFPSANYLIEKIP